MTFANQLTLARILLIPVFVLFAVYYGDGVAHGHPQEWQRLAAVAVFLVASITDAFDGWVARKFGQQSRLGTVLDPIADKGLLLSAIITLSVSHWTYALPLWFPVLVIARDAVILVGCAVLRFFTDHLEIHPNRVGKAATALQMAAVAWIMLQIPQSAWIVWLAGGFTLISGLAYVYRGAMQLTRHDTTLNPS